MKSQLLILSLFISCFLFGCTHNDEPLGGKDKNNPTQQTEDTRYYVKYEAYMPLGYSYTSRKITFITEKGEQSFSIAEDQWEGTYGPLKKGTKLYLQVEKERGGNRTEIVCYARISVCREKEPFVIKAEHREKEASLLYTSYTIDF